MALKKLAPDIQSLFCSSTQICNYKSAVEELVYNSLDAEATSIAIRVNINENSLQVIDNGIGVAKNDFKLIGQRHATSKCTDISTLKSVPNKYGFRGQSLASIIEVSKRLIISSRCADTEETWTKEFYKSKEYKLAKTTVRPSKGTTILGFCYFGIAAWLVNEYDLFKLPKKLAPLPYITFGLSFTIIGVSFIFFPIIIMELQDFLDTYGHCLAITFVAHSLVSATLIVCHQIPYSNLHSGLEKIVMDSGKCINTSTFNFVQSTVEIKGFLHNLHIQKKSINALTELSDIKTFLKQLSLVHNNISLSLRDDSTNEIVFKLHKNRDIYQTLSTVFEVDKRDVQELKVEKNEYKVTAIIANRDKDISQYHWVYLNGKFINSSNIYKVIDEYLIKLLGLKNKKKTTKYKNNLDLPEDITSKKTIPMYFVFITCPYYDYDITFKAKTSTLEFKNWDYIKKMIEKLIKFYVGDIRLKEVTTAKVTKSKSNKKEDETREQVKKIMDRILRSNSKKPRVSQMQNGVRGKIIKRTSKKRIAKLPVTKLVTEKPNEYNENEILNNKNSSPEILKNNSVKNVISTRNGHTVNKKSNKSMKRKEDTVNNLKLKEKPNALQNVDKEQRKQKSYIQQRINKATCAIKNKQPKLKNNRITQKNKNAKKVFQKNQNALKRKTLDDPILNKFKNESNSVKQRCNILTKNVENLMSYQKKRKRKIFVNETIHYSTVVKDNKNVSVRRKVDEIVIQDFIPLPPRFAPCSIDNRVWKKLPEKSCKTSYDLIQTILKSQQECSKAYTNEISAVSSRLNNYDKQIEPFNNDAKYEIDDVSNSVFQNANYYETLSDVQKFTYNSHQHRISGYNRNNNGRDLKRSNNYFELTETRNGKKHFITKQSRDNFSGHNLQLFKNKFENRLNKRFLSTKKQHKWKKSLLANLYNNYNNNSWPEDNSFVIDYTESNNRGKNNNSLDSQNMHNMSSDKPQCENYGIIQSSTVCGGTYTIISNTSNTSCGTGNYEFQQSNHISLTQKTYCIRTPDESRINCNEGKMNFVNEERNEDLVIRDDKSKKKDMNIGLVSQPQNNTLNQSDIEPINICETTMKSNQDLQEVDSIIKINFNDSLFNYDFSVDSVLFDRDAYTNVEHNTENEQEKNYNEIYSQYFGKKNNNLHHAENVLLDNDQVELDLISHKEKIKANDNFKLKTRYRFIPKGLSPIFLNCKTTKACDYNLEQEYYEDTIYNQFVNEVQVQSEIFEPNIQHVKELKSKHIAKVNERLDKDNASLVFNGESLEQAIVLRQVDCKFIATKIKGRCYQSTDVSEYLVLFDQHAVHERIRLEKNLAEYFVEDNWMSVSLDEMPMTLSKEEVIYLHNYRDKFTQLGLEWIVISNEEVKITGIPEAILGKNPRQVDVVMKAVRNLISEEIQAIKSQKGCISLYPKSIMDLVFSEACRYAVKFGDKLSMHECTELLNSLSKCKTPFQCAHGRPVMAVLMGIESDPTRRQYKIVTSKVHQFITSLKLKK